MRNFLSLIGYGFGAVAAVVGISFEMIYWTNEYEDLKAGEDKFIYQTTETVHEAIAAIPSSVETVVLTAMDSADLFMTLPTAFQVAIGFAGILATLGVIFALKITKFLWYPVVRIPFRVVFFFLRKLPNLIPKRFRGTSVNWIGIQANIRDLHTLVRESIRSVEEAHRDLNEGRRWSKEMDAYVGRLRDRIKDLEQKMESSDSDATPVSDAYARTVLKDLHNSVTTLMERVSRLEDHTDGESETAHTTQSPSNDHVKIGDQVRLEEYSRVYTVLCIDGCVAQIYDRECRKALWARLDHLTKAS